METLTGLFSTVVPQIHSQEADESCSGEDPLSVSQSRASISQAVMTRHPSPTVYLCGMAAWGVSFPD